MRNSRKIEDLNPYVAYLCRLLIQKCKEEGIELLVTSTVRDQEYQTALYAQGRTKSGNIVTNAKLIGPHGFGLAFDIVPMVNAKCAWSDNSLWQKIGQIGKGIGLEWAGYWKSFKEMCHFQYTQGLTTAQLRNGKLPNFPSITKYNATIKDATPKLPTKVTMKGEVISSVLNLYPTPNANQKDNGKLKAKDDVNIYKEQNGWYLVNTGVVQWVKKELIKIKGEK